MRRVYAWSSARGLLQSVAYLVRLKGGSVPRSLAGLLTAAGTAMSVLAVVAHSHPVLFMMAAVAGVLTGSAACLASPQKKSNQVHMLLSR